MKIVHQFRRKIGIDRDNMCFFENRLGQTALRQFGRQDLAKIRKIKKKSRESDVRAQSYDRLKCLIEFRALGMTDAIIPALTHRIPSELRR